VSDGNDSARRQRSQFRRRNSAGRVHRKQTKYTLDRLASLPLKPLTSSHCIASSRRLEALRESFNPILSKYRTSLTPAALPEPCDGRAATG